MKGLRAAYSKLERVAYANRHTPDHPVHQQARAAAREYCRAIAVGKAQHWVKWLGGLVDNQVWDVHKFLNAAPSDGSAASMPTLERRVPGTRQLLARAETNEEKCEWLKEEFFPPVMEESSVPDNPVYPPPAWEWKPVSDTLLRRAAARMKPYKATFPGSVPNCIIKECTNLLLPFLGPIYRSLDELGHFPEGWSELHVAVIRKPGKSDYANPGAHRPIALTKGFARWWYAAKTLQQVTEAELAGVLPDRQFG
ncbi:hypothetical protein C8R45DRAFT_846902, partial [Mycena sanguinolenta]